MRLATRADVETLSLLMARAFENDPIQSWLFPDPGRRERRVRRPFELELRHWIIGSGLVLFGDGNDALAALLPPDECRLPFLSAIRILPAYASLIGRRAGAAARGFARMERGHPDELHWHLSILATHPQQQGRGLASALLARHLERCDEEGVPAYLECSSQDNLGFYARHGFNVTEEVMFPGGPPLWLMWRDPGS